MIMQAGSACMIITDHLDFYFTKSAKILAINWNLW